MSACPTPISKSSASARRQQPNCNRDRDPRREEERKRKGYSQVPHRWFADIGRVTRGKSQLLLLFYGWSQSDGRERDRGEPAPDWTIDLTIEELAAIACCSTREVDADLTDAAQRGVIELQRIGKGKLKFRVLPVKWKDLLDYRAPVKAAAAEDQPDEEQPEEEPAAVTKEAVRLFRHPVAISPGKATRAVPVNCGVKSVRVQIDPGVTVKLGFDIVIQRGEMLVMTQPPPQKQRAAFTSQPIVSNKIENFPGSVLPDSGTVGETVSQLRELFDPIWKKHFRPSVPKLDLLTRVVSSLQGTPVPFYASLVHRTFRRQNYPFAPGLVDTIAQEAAKEWQGEAGAAWRREQTRHANDRFGSSRPLEPREMTLEEARNFVRAHERGDLPADMADLLAEARRTIESKGAKC